MVHKDLSTKAREILDECEKGRSVKAVVAQMCLDGDSSYWDGVIIPALVEIVQRLLDEREPDFDPVLGGMRIV
jgi:hypothetical protein